VQAGDLRLGFIGELHPQVAAVWELGQTAVWSIDLGLVAAVAPERTAFVPFASFPAATEDLAVLVGLEVAAAEVIAVVREAGGAELESVELFDVYEGEQVGSGRRSLALHVGFRAADRTLTTEEIATAREAIAAALASRLGGELRA
jgi:phenylalanyl-tRNA synthetase beta chain